MAQPDPDESPQPITVDAAARDRGPTWRMRFLVEAGAAMDGSLDWEETLQRVARIAVPALADWCTVFVIARDGEAQRVAAVHKDEALREAVLAYQRNYPPDERATRGLYDALRARSAVLRRGLDDEYLRAAARDQRHLDLMRQLGCTSFIVAPMFVRGEIIGAMSFMLSDGNREFEDDDLTLAQELARRAAIAVDHARLYREALAREQGKRQETERRLELLIDSIEDYAVFMLDPGGNVATWNRGAEHLQGYTRDEIVGRHFSIFHPSEEGAAGKCSQILDEATRTGRVEDPGGWRVKKDGTRFWAHVVIGAIRDENGRLVGFSKVTRDLTERRRIEEERAARRDAERESRAKDSFLAMLGHELRNPLAPIVTALQLMKLRGDGTPTREQQIIERQVNYMVRLVDDLLDVSRITAGKIELKRAPLDLRDVVAHGIETASPWLEQRRHRFEVVSPPRPVPIEGDEARLAQVFANLVTNAAKYTEPGGNVTVSIHESGSEAIVEVRDDGVGISEEMLPDIFELFVQGAQGSERSAGGLGIGLSLVRSLVQMHRGYVGVSSPGSGAGSTFTVILPLAEPQALRVVPREPKPQLVDEPARKILVVDDNEDALGLLAEALRACGHDVQIATDGLAALELVRRFQPEVAVLDIGLPIIDGWELAARIAREHRDAAPRLIALSGYGRDSDRRRSAESGFAAHLVKPITAETLLETIRSVAIRVAV
jgi:PAS domain S-box-containing protein